MSKKWPKNSKILVWKYIKVLELKKNQAFLNKGTNHKKNYMEGLNFKNKNIKGGGSLKSTYNQKKFLWVKQIFALLYGQRIVSLIQRNFFIIFSFFIEFKKWMYTQSHNTYVMWLREIFSLI